MLTTDIVPTQDDLAEVRERANDTRSLLDPEWRFTRARRLHTENVVYFGRDEDFWVVHLTKFLKAYHHATAPGMPAIEHEFPDIKWAYAIHDAEDRGPRYHLEALVVANKHEEDIADFLALPIAVVTAYESCFFDMRRHMHHRGAVQAYITMRAKSRGMRDLDPDPFWKRIALSEGEDMLRALWGDGVLEASDMQKFDHLISSYARRNCLEAMRVREIQPINANDIIIEYGVIKKLELDQERAEADSRTPGGGIGEIVAALMHSINFTVASVDETSKQSFIEMNSALEQSPALLARLQGAAEKRNAPVPETSE